MLIVKTLKVLQILLFQLIDFQGLLAPEESLN